MVRRGLIAAARALLPVAVRDWIVATQRRFGLVWPRVRHVDFGSLQRRTPISAVFGLDRGQSVTRYYIERFLDAHRADVRGRVLEFGDDRYTRQYGGGHVTCSDVLSVAAGPGITMVADLTRADDIPPDLFDCIIATQTLQMIYRPAAAAAHLYRILRPGGVLLVTSHGLSRIGRWEGVDAWGEYWHFTSQSLRRTFEGVFPPEAVEVRSYGNVFAAISELHGLAVEELEPADIDYHDPAYQVVVAMRARKPSKP